MSDIEDDVRWAHEAYYLAETGEHLGSAMQVDPSHDAAIRAVIKATREQVAQRLQVLLPGVLAATAYDAFGWLSDAQDAALAPGRFDSGSLVFHGEGSIDLLQVGEYAARIARGES